MYHTCSCIYRQSLFSDAVFIALKIAIALWWLIFLIWSCVLLNGNCIDCVYFDATYRGMIRISWRTQQIHHCRYYLQEVVFLRMFELPKEGIVYFEFDFKSKFVFSVYFWCIRIEKASIKYCVPNIHSISLSWWEIKSQVWKISLRIINFHPNNQRSIPHIIARIVHKIFKITIIFIEGFPLCLYTWKTSHSSWFCCAVKVNIIDEAAFTNRYYY